MSKSIKDWQKEIHQLACDKGWWEEDRNTGEILALIHSEISEALEEWRAGIALQSWYRGEDGKPCGFPVELADACIRIFDYAERIGIDLEEFISLKTEHNKTRSHRHGGKIA